MVLVLLLLSRTLARRRRDINVEGLDQWAVDIVASERLLAQRVCRRGLSHVPEPLRDILVALLARRLGPQYFDDIADGRQVED